MLDKKEEMLSRALKELARFGNHIVLAQQSLSRASNYGISDEMCEYLNDLHDKLTDMMFEVSRKRITWTKEVLGGGFDNEHNGETLDNTGEVRGA